ncbi:MAG: PmoA family protein [Gemmataceae bacterium]
MIALHRLLPLVFLVAAPAAAEPEIAATVADDKASVEFHAGKQLVTRYHIGPAVAKPYFYPVLAPGGVPVTRDWPMKTGAPQETKDHVHQKSAWFCHGDVIPEGLAVAPSGDTNVKGVDFWSEGKGHGVIVCVEVNPVKDDPAAVLTRNEWRDSSGTRVLDEARTIRLRPAAGGYLLVVDIDLGASVRPLTFGDTKEGSMGVRVRDEIRLSAKPATGALTNSNDKSGENEVWGMLADWCDYSGAVDGQPVGIALFDDPANKPRACWHSRGYGLMAANPFGRKASGFPAMRDRDDLVKLAKGEHLKLRYGMFLHAGDVKDGKVAEAFAAFGRKDK